MANGVRVRGEFNAGLVQPLRVGELLRPEGFVATPEEDAAVLAIVGAIGPHWQEFNWQLKANEMLAEVTGKPGYMIAYAGEESQRPLAFAKISQLDAPGPSYLLEQFNDTCVCPPHDKGTEPPPAYKKAAAALLHCMTQDFPDTACLYAQWYPKDTRTGYFLKGMAGFTGVIEPGSGIVHLPHDKAGGALPAVGHHSWRRSRRPAPEHSRLVATAGRIRTALRRWPEFEFLPLAHDTAYWD